MSSDDAIRLAASIVRAAAASGEYKIAPDQLLEILYHKIRKLSAQAEPASKEFYIDNTP